MTAPLPKPAHDGAPHWTTVDWAPFTRNNLVSGRRIRYVDYGTGPVLVLLHGMAASWQWWLENIPSLSEQHRVIAVDLPGFGHSEALPAPAEMSAHAQVVLDLLDQLGIGSAIVAGHSMGGLIALEMVAADPVRTRELVLVGAGGVPMTERRLSMILAVLRICAAIAQRDVVRRALATRSWIRRIALRGGFRDPRVLSAELAAQIMPIFAGPGFMDAVAAAGRAVRQTRPSSVSCPVLLLWGEFDVMAPLTCARDMHDELPESELVVINGVGHTPMIESPEAFTRALLQFSTRTR